jgi:hypothetical protein
LDVSVYHKIDTGIVVKDSPGIVPLFHEIEACNAANHSFFGSWQKLSRRERVVLVTHYFISRSIEGHKNDANIKKMKRDQRRGRGKRG